ncbi:hypothetical protein Taro_035826, partial [Colocasia esculenta]|nr:hypothetical protein [Colocasia esculenta]
DIGLRIEVLHCNLHLVAGKVVVHVVDAFICIWIRLKKDHLIIIVVIVANQDIIEVHVQGHNPLITTKMEQFAGPVDTFVLYAQSSHRSQLVHAGQLWSWERLHVGRPDIAMHPLSQDMSLGHRCGIIGQITLYHRMRRLLVLVEGSIWLGIGLSLGGTLLGQVQRTDSSTSHAGPSEPCAGTPQEPDDAGPSHFSPDVMTVSQYGLYDVGAS